MPRPTRTTWIAVCLTMLLVSLSSAYLIHPYHGSPASAFGINEGNLQVNVTDEAGRPITGANVTIYGNSSYWLTGINGQVLITNLSVGNQVVNASKSGYINESKPVIVVDGVLRYVDLQVRGGGLNGYIMSMSSSPVENATIQIVGYAQYQTTSDATGAYSLTGMPTGNYLFNVLAAGYSAKSENIAIAAGSTLLHNFNLTYLLCSISGYVFDNGTSVADVEMSVQVGKKMISVWTDSNGLYKLDDLPSGNYTVTASKDGYSEGAVSGIIVANGSETRNINFSIVGMPARLYGTVTAIITAGSVLLYGALVEIIGTVFNDTTGTQGNYEMFCNQFGTFNVRASAPGYIDNVTYGVSLRRGESVNLEIVLTPKPGQLMGTVRADDTHEPLSGFRVTISGPEQRETVTNDQGQYVFAGLAPGNYTITVVSTNGTSRYSPYVASNIKITSEGTTTHDVYMTLVKQSLGGFIFGMDLPHSFMVLSFFITIIILTMAAYLRLKRLSGEEKGSPADTEMEDEPVEEEKREGPPGQ
ncbi:MAG TPA: carboxypeptidase-like regulatory domain-containing protein [Thermoplasmata archaeon]|nr:carboxypeptidase-like regulatory domain-containing protein [Thermoplasmata archaeon]